VFALCFLGDEVLFIDHETQGISNIAFAMPK
jgi:hypothetical protein